MFALNLSNILRQAHDAVRMKTKHAAVDQVIRDDRGILFGRAPRNKERHPELTRVVPREHHAGTIHGSLAGAPGAMSMRTRGRRRTPLWVQAARTCPSRPGRRV